MQHIHHISYNEDIQTVPNVLVILKRDNLLFKIFPNINKIIINTTIADHYDHYDFPIYSFSLLSFLSFIESCKASVTYEIVACRFLQPNILNISVQRGLIVFHQQ